MLKKTLLTLLCLVFLPLPTLAHTTGFFIEKITGEYLFDIGYSSEFIAGDFIRFDLLLLKADNKEIVPFNDAWVRISQGEKLIFAGPIAYGEFGKPGFSFVFPEGGDYSLSIRFENSLKSIAEAIFPIQVKAGPTKSGKSPVLMYGGILLLGLAGGFFGSKLFKKHV